MKPLKAVAARDLGMQFVANPHRMVGQDGAYSIPLRRGGALWFFGDTLVGRRTPGESLWYPGGQRLGPGDMSGHGGIERLLTNTGLVLRDTTGRHGARDFGYVCGDDGELRPLVPREADEHPDEIRIWCLHGIDLGEHLYLYYLAVRMLADGPMPVNFELVGCGLARGNGETMRFERVLHAGRLLWWPSTLPQFGTSVLLHDGHLYVYGVLRDGGGVQRCHVARVRADGIENLDEYEYLSSPAPSWSSRPEDACCIMTGMPNEMSVSWNAHLGCFLAVHSLDLSGQIVGRTAPTPWGPWSDHVVLWQCVPPRLDYHVPYPTLIYAGKEHPELAEGGGRVLYLTYIEFEEYFPHLVEVEIE